MTGYPCGFCFVTHRPDSLIGKAHAWQDGDPLIPWRTYPIKPLRPSAVPLTTDGGAPASASAGLSGTADVRRRTLASSG